MAVEYRRLIVIAIFSVCMLFIRLERVLVKPYGHWGPSKFGFTATTLQSHAALRVLSTRVSVQARGEEYSYIAELWECGKAGAVSSLPCVFYWCYYWYF